MRNLELKARRQVDAETARTIALSLGANDLGVLEQEDTYFHCPFGKLKLRTTSVDRGGELIAYSRKSESTLLLSHYEQVPILDADALKSALKLTLGVRVNVRKRRQSFLCRGIRIHVDEVENLGNFLEFEAPLNDESNMDEVEADLHLLSQQYGLDLSELLYESYSDMLLINQLQCQSVS